MNPRTERGRDPSRGWRNGRLIGPCLAPRERGCILRFDRTNAMEMKVKRNNDLNCRRAEEEQHGRLSNQHLGLELLGDVDVERNDG